MNMVAPEGSRGGNTNALPLQQFLLRCHAEIAGDTSGAVADYIPELFKADPAHFGISLATIDGHVYETGDSAVPFTIQSISKAFVFSLALEMLGPERVHKAIGVEPSGDAFNSIRLLPDNRPFNAMVNAGAITCSGLICEAEGDNAFNHILEMLGRFAGRKLGVDEAVFQSESATGDRNRAIGYLLRNNGMLKGDVSRALETYFRQCSILVTARDLAVMAATMANRGFNPVTREKVISSNSATRTLSVMTSAGMYDYAGEWIYRVGIPAKSGVGGGILAAIPSQLGLGTYSPKLDEHGNSVRGIKTCEAFSSYFDLHVLNRSGDVRGCIVADYDVAGISSRRSRLPKEQEILDAHQKHNRVFELGGALTFETAEYLSRRLAALRAPCRFITLDFRRVPSVTAAAAKFLSDCLDALSRSGIRAVLCGIERASKSVAFAELVKREDLRKFANLSDAIEWMEDQVIYSYGGFQSLGDALPLSAQPLMAGLAANEIQEIEKLMKKISYNSGERILQAGDTSCSVIFLLSGMASVKLPNGTRLATLSAGMSVGEMAFLEEPRSADVWADAPVTALELPQPAWKKFRDTHPKIAERIARNFSALLAKRLVAANTKIEALTSH
jgi:glutaminase